MVPVMTPQEERNADIESNTEPDPPYVIPSTCLNRHLVQLSSNSLTHSRFLYDSLVTVQVGSQATRFDLHKGLLCASSDFFKAAVTGDFKERDQNEIRLPEQDVKIFRFFVHWLYTGRLRGYYYPRTAKPSLHELKQAVIAELGIEKMDSLQNLDPDLPNGQALYMANYRDAPFSHLVGLYILADTLLVHGLKDQIITLIIDVYCWSPPTGVAADVAKANGTQPKGAGADEAEAFGSDFADEAQTYTTPFGNATPYQDLKTPAKASIWHGRHCLAILRSAD